MDTLEEKNGRKTQGFFAGETWEIFDGRSSTFNENPERSGLRSKPIWSELYVAFGLRQKFLFHTMGGFVCAGVSEQCSLMVRGGMNGEAG